ncbi:GNAT family N-acetyltransferase [Nocardioides speluncae]|uniref:GNAT family N-acetyltransferase n=1 Tax=Nocardioides speluncae TaxID=2670337 RepID=UPI000D699089|nr:GNAT family N-acetyltransferase [Nocardioides speluncae]
MEIQTERLLIRPWRDEEAPRLYDMQSRVEVMRWLGDGSPNLMSSVDQAVSRIAFYRLRSLLPPQEIWAVEVRDGSPRDGTVAGTVLLQPLPNGAGECEIGWHLHPDSWGHGYATEAGRAVLEHAWAGGLSEVHAVTHPDNEPSQRICHKLGLRDQGVTERWYGVPMRHYLLSYDEWAGR